MLRYLRELADRDLALDRTMIPLGSCTMKLNATAEMEPITWPEWGRIHPFAPVEQVGGYLELIGDLERWLAEITGYDAVSLQPNAGSQGEYAGLLAIRSYHASRGEPERDVCLIPASAHGTNAASAAMAGMRVVVVKCDDNGNVDLDDLDAKIDAARRAARGADGHVPVDARRVRRGHRRHLRAASTITAVRCTSTARTSTRSSASRGPASSAPTCRTSTCTRRSASRTVVAVRVSARSACARTSRRTCRTIRCNPKPVRDGGVTISAAPWGSAGILPISWAYITMMGAEGLRQATQVAILNANYLARRLAPHYPVLYTGAHGLVAHECIIDLRPITHDTGVTVDDVAKRLIDYGFHAPTMSFPVAGTLMIEPTESEDRAELDRFIDAMVAIRAEIDAVGRRRLARRRQPARARAAHRARRDARRLEACVLTRARRVPAARAAAPQVLAAGRPHRQRLRRPQRVLLLPARRGVRIAPTSVPA